MNTGNADNTQKQPTQVSARVGCTQTGDRQAVRNVTQGETLEELQPCGTHTEIGNTHMHKIYTQAEHSELRKEALHR